MFTPTKRQMQWLRKAHETCYKKLFYYPTQVFNGQVYLAALSQHRLHAIPAPGLEPNKRYDLVEDQFVYVDDKAVSWVQMVPLHFTQESTVYRSTLKTVKENAVEDKGGIWKAYIIPGNPKIGIDPLYFFEAIWLTATCTQRTNGSRNPIRFDYADGSLAVVMPMDLGCFDV